MALTFACFARVTMLSNLEYSVTAELNVFSGSSGEAHSGTRRHATCQPSAQVPLHSPAPRPKESPSRDALAAPGLVNCLAVTSCPPTPPTQRRLLRAPPLSPPRSSGRLGTSLRPRMTTALALVQPAPQCSPRPHTQLIPNP